MYLTADDVYNAVKALTPDNDQTATITSYIKEESSILNGILSPIYQLPIPNTPETDDARSILKGIVMYKVLARLEMFLNLSGNTDESGQAIVDKVTYWSMHKQSTKKISMGEIRLPNVPLVERFVTSNFPKARFDRNIENW